MALIGTVASFAACGSKEAASTGESGEPAVEESTTEEAAVEEEPEGDDNLTGGAAFGAGVAAEYPISSEMQSQLDTLGGNYAKVNWQVAYAPSNNDGLIVSETSYCENNHNFLVVAFTNLTDEGIKMSFEGYSENAAGDVVQDLLESDVELGPKCTIVRNVEFKDNEPSGEIKWNNFNVDAGTEVYVPWEMTSELGKDASGYYYIDSTITADVNTSHDSYSGYGYILDKDGNILAGASEADGYKAKFYGTQSFGGENADYVYFVNVYKAHF